MRHGGPLKKTQAYITVPPSADGCGLRGATTGTYTAQSRGCYQRNGYAKPVDITVIENGTQRLSDPQYQSYKITNGYLRENAKAGKN